MIKLFGFKLYFGTPGFGWIMYGIGYEDVWFLGLSINKTRIATRMPRETTMPSVTTIGPSKWHKFP